MIIQKQDLNFFNMFMKVVFLAGTAGLLSAAVADDEVNCLDSAYCALIKGDVAKVSDKYGKDSGKYYKEAQDFLAKGVEYNNTKTETIQKECQNSLKTCSDEAFTMAVDGLNFPGSIRGKCSFETFSRTIFGCRNLKDWPAEVRKVLPSRRLDCRTECPIDDGNKYTLSNGKNLISPSPREDYNMTDIPQDLESRYRPNGGVGNETFVNRTVDEWISGLGDTNLNGPDWGFQDPCPLGSFVDEVDNFRNNTRNLAGNPLFHIDMRCRTTGGGKKTDDIQGHILSKFVGKIRQFSTGTTNTTAAINFPEYDSTKDYISCNGGFAIGVSLSQKTYKKGKGIEYVNVLCGNSPWTIRGTQIDSDQMICKQGMAVCALQTKIGPIETQWGSSGTIVDARIGCCTIALTNLTVNIVGPAPTTTTTPVPVPVNPGPTPETGNPGGDDGIYNLQKKFLLVWGGQIHNNIITRYYYYYTPNPVDNEREWETTKCADGTFVNSFEITTPVSTYYWTRRIIQIKFKCGAVDGSKSNEIDLYKKLLTKGFTLQNPDTEFAGTKECKGGYYTSMKLNYYEDKTRQKIALVNAWELTMTCSKGGSIEPQSHLINSTPKNIVADNFVDSGMVDCGTGKAICGFSNKVTAENRKGAFEGVFYRVVCCSV